MISKECWDRVDYRNPYSPDCFNNPNDQFDEPKPLIIQSIDKSENLGIQLKFFKQMQYILGSSWRATFRESKKTWFRRIMTLMIGIVSMISLYQWIFVDDEPIYDIQTATSFDNINYEPVNITNTFTSSTPYIYITFGVRDFEIGTHILVKMFYSGDARDYYYKTYAFFYVSVIENNQHGFGRFVRPLDGWLPGEYQVVFLNDCEYITQIKFTIK